MESPAVVPSSPLADHAQRGITPQTSLLDKRQQRHLPVAHLLVPLPGRMVKSTKLVGTSTVRTKNTLHFGPLLALSFSHVPLSLFYRPASFIGPPTASEVGSPQSLAVCTARGGWGNLMSVRLSVHDWSAAWPLPRPHGHARVHIRWQPALVRQGSGRSAQSWSPSAFIAATGPNRSNLETSPNTQGIAISGRPSCRS